MVRESSPLLLASNTPPFSFAFHFRGSLSPGPAASPFSLSGAHSPFAFCLFSFSSLYVLRDLQLELSLDPCLSLSLMYVPFSLRPWLSSSVSSPRPSHLCTSSLSLSIFSVHTTAVLFPPSVYLSLSLSQIIAASLSVSCFLLSKALSVSLWTFFFAAAAAASF